MPKPVTVPTEWATNAVHLVGDYPGSVTKVAPGAGVIAAGLIPGDIFAPTAEELNDVWNLWSQYAIWVSEGDATGAASAHIVETDSNGKIYCVALQADCTGFEPAVKGTSLTGDSGVRGISASSGGRGVRGEGYSYGGYFQGTGVAGFGVYGEGAGTGQGGRFLGGPSRAGVRADGGAAGPGAQFYGKGGAPDIDLDPDANNYGIHINCGATCLSGIQIQTNGKIGLAIYSSTAYQGIWMSGAQTVGIAQMYMECTGAGDGLNVSSAGVGTGHLIKLTPKLASPTKAPLLLEGQNGLPSGTVEGGIGYDRAKQKFYNGRRNVASPMYFWDGPSGLGPALYNVTGQVSNTNSALPTAAITKALNLAATESAWVVCRLDLGWQVSADSITVTVQFDNMTQYQREIYCAFGASDTDQVKQTWMWQGKATNVTNVTVTIARVGAGTVWARNRSLIALQTIYSNEWV